MEHPHDVEFHQNRAEFSPNHAEFTLVENGIVLLFILALINHHYLSNQAATTGGLFSFITVVCQAVY